MSKVVVCPSDQTGCGKYRLIWPAEALRSRGVNITIQPRPRILVNSTSYPHKVMDVLLPEETKTIVFQRPGSYQITQLIPILQNKGVKVVIDLDDDLSCIHPLNPSHQVYDPKLSPYRNWEWIKKACKLANIVTATTEALLDTYAKNNGILIPNCIPDHFLKIEKIKNEIVTVGWAGWVRTHPNDLQVTHGAINEAIAKKNARFMAIGDKDAFNKLQIRDREPNIYHPGVNFDDYPATVSKLDIGIVPLEDSQFNRSKSWLKALEYASLGVAPVVSPTPDNLKLVEQGAAFVARSPKMWKEIIQNLIVNDTERNNLAKAAREVAAKWTITENAWRWSEAWGIV